MDFPSLDRCVRTVADALLAHNDIIEIDCNPVIFRDGKLTVVDALVALQAQSTG